MFSLIEGVIRVHHEAEEGVGQLADATNNRLVLHFYLAFLTLF